MAGIAETGTIDLVAQDAAGEFLVVMVETRRWGADPAQARQLREKINSYAAFILDGGLARRFPETVGQAVHVQLDCPEAPRGEIAEITAHAAAQLTRLGIGFRVNVRPEA